MQIVDVASYLRRFQRAAAAFHEPARELPGRAPTESLFASLKAEHVNQARCRTRDKARAALFYDLAIFHNRRRLRSDLGCRTPAEAWAGTD